MLILLPPSEGKTTPGVGDPVDPAGLWLPTLAPARRRVLTRLVALCRRTSARSVAESLRMLGLSPGQWGEISRNATLADAPTARADEVYTGVLYEALNPTTLPSAAREWWERSAVIFSGLWGVVRPADRIPAYRCPVGATLPTPVGGLTAYWRKALRQTLDRAVGDGPVVDLRSGAYAAMWSSVAAPTATVRVLHERYVDGVPRRSVVSHFNKATKGRIVRALAEAAAEPRSIDDVAAALRDLKFRVEETPVATRPGIGTPPSRIGAKLGRTPRQLDIVVAEL